MFTPFARARIADAEQGKEYEMVAGYSSEHLLALVNAMINKGIMSISLESGALVVQLKEISSFEPIGKFRLQREKANADPSGETAEEPGDEAEGPADPPEVP